MLSVGARALCDEGENKQKKPRREKILMIKKFKFQREKNEF
jgi:hypothetical protein